MNLYQVVGLSRDSKNSNGNGYVSSRYVHNLDYIR